MQFFSTILMSTLALSSIAIAAPMEIKERQSTSPFDAINSIVSNVNSSVSSDLVSLSSAFGNLIGTITGDTTYAENAINSNLESIADTFEIFTGSLVIITTDVVNGAGHTIVDLAEAEVSELTAAIIIVNDVLFSILQTFQQTVLTLIPTIKDAISSEGQAVLGDVDPFVLPLFTLAKAIIDQGGLQTIDLIDAVDVLQSTVNDLALLQFD